MSNNENTNVEVEMENVVELICNAKVSKEEKEELKQYAKDKAIVGYIVDQYYQSQSYRIAAQNQIRALMQGYDDSQKEHPGFIKKELENAMKQETLNKKYMDIITDEILICQWMKSITGIGPVLAAYLYSVLDVTRGRYATDFLSYAGLNDNNNPWLGTEKAKQIVNNAVIIRKDSIFNVIEDRMKNWIGDNIEKVMKRYKKDYKDSDIDLDNLTTTAQIVTKKSIISAQDIFSDMIPELEEYIRCYIHPNYAGDILFGIVAGMVKRKVSNIKNGTINIKKKNKKGAATASTADLAAYLAKPPYNLDLKKRCYLIGESFIKVSGNEKSLYGRIYRERKMYETTKNENGDYADQASVILESKNFDKNTEAYKYLIQGKLPLAQIHARARRYAVKLFISHVYEAMYFAEYGKEAPRPYVIQHMGHHDYIAPEVDFKPYLNGRL